MSKEQTEEKLSTEQIIQNHIAKLNASFITVRDAQNEPCYYYKDGIYHPWGDRVAKQILACDPLIPLGVINNVVARIKAETLKPRSVFDADIMRITLLNGILNLRTKKLEPFSEEYPATIQVPVNYDPEAKCPQIEKFLSEVINPEDFPVVYELFGYCLLRNYSIKKLFLLIGDNDSGKGTFLRLLTSFLGVNNISSVDPMSLGKDRFSTFDLRDKLANICGDLPTTIFKNTGKIKSLTGDDLISAEEKFGGRTTFINYAKFVFATNTAPVIPESELDTFIKRFQFIPFPYVIQHKDIELIHKITTPEELSGLLNHAILGLIRLQGQTRFSNHKSKEELLKFLEEYSSIEMRFIKECMKEKYGAFTPKAQVYSQYAAYCKLRGVPFVSTDKFWKMLWGHFADVRPNIDVRKSVEGKQTEVIAHYEVVVIPPQKNRNPPEEDYHKPSTETAENLNSPPSPSRPPYSSLEKEEDNISNIMPIWVGTIEGDYQDYPEPPPEFFRDPPRTPEEEYWDEQEEEYLRKEEEYWEYQAKLCWEHEGIDIEELIKKNEPSS